WVLETHVLGELTRHIRGPMKIGRYAAVPLDDPFSRRDLAEGSYEIVSRKGFELTTVATISAGFDPAGVIFNHRNHAFLDDRQRQRAEELEILNRAGKTLVDFLARRLNGERHPHPRELGQMAVTPEWDPADKNKILMTFRHPSLFDPLIIATIEAKEP